ncbi:putative mitochondrial protein [Sesamum alatum]|uniref:Mitochondrial protein n=1 Tax=Sesamum alatum TaxID=300844 RepID=A0AAE2C7N9_9LAMI|nr:putative mitochondrial protein [Sesamum alatum]
MKTRTRLPAANGIAPELLPSSFLLYSFVPLFPFKRGRGKQAKLATDRRGKSLVTEVDYRTGVGKNLAKGTTFLIPLQAQGIRFSFTLGETENSISGEALVVAGGGGKAFSGPVNGES